MKPADYIDGHHVPAEDVFSPESIDEKSELRKSIKRSSRRWVIISCITAVLFAIVGTILLVDQKYLGATMSLSIALYWGYLGHVYYRIPRVSTAMQMRHQLDKLLLHPVLTGSEPPLRVMSLIAVGAAVVLALDYNSHWFVTPLIVLIISLLIVVLFWTWRKYWFTCFFPQDDEIENEIERLQHLEEG